MTPERRAAALVSLARRGIFFREWSLVIEQFRAVSATIFVVEPSLDLIPIADTSAR